MEKKTLRCLLHNTQDLFIFMDKYKGESLRSLNEIKWQMLSTSLFSNKNLKKLFGLASTYEKYQSDILFFVEVGGPESLENFNKHFLHDAYQVFHSPTNSDRGIDMGILVKKEIAKDCVYRAHTKNKLSNGKVFSRGVLELKYKNFVFLLTHLKSKLNLRNTDFEGRTQRQAEVLELQRIFLNAKKKNNKAEVFILGDLNGIYGQVSTEPEFKPLEEIKLIDALTHLGIDENKKTTMIYFDRGHNAHHQQLDYVLSDDFSSLQEAEISEFFQDELIMPRPLKFKDKLELPSDHYPYFFSLKLP